MPIDWNALSTNTRKAWTQIKNAEAKAWAQWMVVGEGLYEGRRLAMQQAQTDKPEGKGYALAYGEWLRRCKVDDMDGADRAKLLQIMEERPAIEEWRARLPINVRRSLNNPTVVWRRWQKDTKVAKPKAKGKGDARARAMVEQQQGRIEELEQELQGRVGLSPDDSATYVASTILEMFTADEAREIAALIVTGLRERAKRKPDAAQEGARP